MLYNGNSANNFHRGDVKITGDLDVDGDQTIEGTTVYANDVLFEQDVQIDGDLDVKGTITSVDQLEVKDPLIKLADGNSADTSAIGYYGQYDAGFGTRYMGLIKPPSTDTFQLFTNNPTEPTPGGFSASYWGNLQLSQLRCQAQTGVTSTPTISSATDTDTGLQWNDTFLNTMFMSVGGVRNFALSNVDLKIGNFDSATFYSLPLTRGTSGQVLKTDGLGIVTWQTDTGGGTLALDGSTQMDASAQIIADSGLVSAPAYTIAGDLTTGIYQPTPGQLAVSITGSDTMVFKSSVSDLYTDVHMFAPNSDERREIDLYAQHNTSSANIKMYRKRNPADPNMIAGTDMMNLFGLGWSTLAGAYQIAGKFSIESTGVWNATNFPSQAHMFADSGALGSTSIYCGYDGSENNIILTPTDNEPNPEFKVSSTLTSTRVPLTMTLASINNKVHLIDTSATSSSFLTFQLDTNSADRRRICYYMDNDQRLKICPQNDAGAVLGDIFRIRNETTATNNGLEAPDGVPANTGYGFITQQNMGMYRIAFDILGFSTNATERLRISNTQLTSTLPVIAPRLDNAGSLLLGDTSATSVSIGKTGITTTVNGSTNLIQATTFGTGGTNYVLPTTRGTNNQILRTNATGTVSWQTPIFGQHYQYANSDGLATTTFIAYSQKLRMTTPTLTAGTYRIMWYCEIKNDSGTGGNIEVRLDDTTPPMGGTLIGTYFTDSSVDGGFQSSSGIYNQVLTAAAHTVDINYNAGAGITSVQRARLEIMRVA